jgi:hypothetical protein
VGDSILDFLLFILLQINAKNRFGATPLEIAEKNGLGKFFLECAGIHVSAKPFPFLVYKSRFRESENS